MNEDVSAENPYAYQEPPARDAAKHSGPIKVTRTSEEEKAKRERGKQARKVRRARSIVRSGILFYTIIYFGVAAIALMVGSLVAGLEGELWGLIFGVISLVIGAICLGLLFWAKTKTVPACILALGIAVILIIGLLTIGGRWSVGYLLMVSSYCVYGLFRFRRDRKTYRELAAEHERRGLLPQKKEAPGPGPPSAPPAIKA